MVSLSNRTSMALFSDPLDHYSHRVRIVMAEKGITSEIIDTEKDWCPTFGALVDNKLSDSQMKKAKQDFKSQILALSPILKEKPYFMSEDFSLVDCVIAPILWRLPQIGIELPKDTKTKPIYEYMQRVFTRPCFLGSLSELEEDIRS